MDGQRGERGRNGVGGRRPYSFSDASLGIGGVLVFVLLGWLLFKDPLALFEQDARTPEGDVTPARMPPHQRDFVRAILGSTEKTWSDLLAARKRQYVFPTLELFSGAAPAACGGTRTAAGPFYCPRDRRIYLDLSFFRALQEGFRAEGDFARAYVIAHEVGHHVQQQLGIFEQVARARAHGMPMRGADGLSVRQELQADCFAGVWAKRSEQRLHWMEPGDIESALDAASRIGDDELQRRAQGMVVPDSFTHGTPEQRAKWFRNGLEGGRIRDCDTFSAHTL